MTKRRALLLFAIAMAFMEAAVVVYLRRIFYPEGFGFPLVAMSGDLIAIEIVRELATILMLYGVAWLSAASGWGRFAAFMLIFGVWDLFYYVFLWMTLRWPPSLFTWDILFLIPLPWSGPVLAPVIVSISLIVAASVIQWAESERVPVKTLSHDWVFLGMAGLLVLTSFLWNAGHILAGRSPESFRWDIFLLGEVLGAAVFYRAAWKAFRLWDRAHPLGAEKRKV